MNASLFNTTELTSTAAATTPASLLLIQRLRWLLLVFLTPTVSVVGFVGNILSIIVISRDGFQKSSNVLLIALAVSDTAVLIGNSVEVLFKMQFSRALTYGVSINYFLYYVYNIFCKCMLTFGILCCYSFPILITFERLCAVVFPLKFHIITPVRTLASILVFVTVYLTYIIFYAMSIKLGDPIEFRGKVYMVIQSSDLYYEYIDLYATLSRVFNEMTGTVPIVLVVLGNLVIGYKIKIASRRRAKMTSLGDQQKVKRNASQSRTTKTLLTVCITFVVLNGFSYIYDNVQKEININFTTHEFLFHINTLVFCINCSCNFFISVLNNNKFRASLIALFSRKTNDSGKAGKPNNVQRE